MQSLTLSMWMSVLNQPSGHNFIICDKLFIKTIEEKILFAKLVLT